VGDGLIRLWKIGKPKISQNRLLSCSSFKSPPHHGKSTRRMSAIRDLKLEHSPDVKESNQYARHKWYNVSLIQHHGTQFKETGQQANPDKGVYVEMEGIMEVRYCSEDIDFEDETEDFSTFSLEWEKSLMTFVTRTRWRPCRLTFNTWCATVTWSASGSIWMTINTSEETDLMASSGATECSKS